MATATTETRMANNKRTQQCTPKWWTVFDLSALRSQHALPHLHADTSDKDKDKEYHVNSVMHYSLAKKI